MLPAIASFFGATLLIIITQWLIAERERRKQIRDERRKSYLALIPCLTRAYVDAMLRRKLSDDEEIELIRSLYDASYQIAIIGSDRVFEALQDFLERILDRAATEDLDGALSNVAIKMCDDIHEQPPSLIGMGKMIERVAGQKSDERPSDQKR